MSAKRDSYIEQLAKIVQEAEIAYKLNNLKVNNANYLDADIGELMSIITDDIKSLSKQEIQNRNIKAGKAIALLPFISMRLRFYNKKRLDFSHYPAMDTVAKILLTFTRADAIQKDANAIRDVNKIVQLLSEIDARFINFRGGLGYRYLRIFVILVYYGNYVNAACVADFILNQFVVRRG